MTDISVKATSPISMTESILVSTNIPENDHPQWNPATAYTIGQRVIRQSLHAIYQRKVAGTTPTAPENDPTNWAYVSPTNAWKLFDGSSGTATTSATTISYKFAPSVAVNVIAGLNVVGSNIRIRVFDAMGELKFDVERGLSGVISEPTWFNYFFETPNVFDQLIVRDAPPIADGQIWLDIEPSGGVASIGTFMFGKQKAFGLGAELGAAFGIQDYSIKATDEFGQTVFVERSFARRSRFQMMVKDDQADQLFAFLVTRRAKPTLYIVTDRFESAVIFGFFRDFSQIVSFPTTHSVFELELESLA